MDTYEVDTWTLGGDKYKYTGRGSGSVWPADPHPPPSRSPDRVTHFDACGVSASASGWNAYLVLLSSRVTGSGVSGGESDGLSTGTTMVEGGAHQGLVATIVPMIRTVRPTANFCQRMTSWWLWLAASVEWSRAAATTSAVRSVVRAWSWAASIATPPILADPMAALAASLSFRRCSSISSRSFRSLSARVSACLSISRSTSFRGVFTTPAYPLERIEEAEAPTDPPPIEWPGTDRGVLDPRSSNVGPSDRLVDLVGVRLSSRRSEVIDG